MNNNEPLVLGKIKKGSSGKPLLAVFLIIIMGIFILYLPVISNYFGDYNIITLIKEGRIIDFFINHDNYFEENIKKEQPKETDNKSKLINSKTTLILNNISLTNFQLTNESIEFTIINQDNIDLNNSNYYLILTQNDKVIATIKLLNLETLMFKFKSKLNSTVEIHGIIKEIKESEYPNYVISTDESGLGTLYCIKDNYSIEYIISNNKLIRIKETINYSDNNNDYINKFEDYSNLVSNLNNNGQTANIVENYSGFTYTNDIDLSTYTEIKENYYSLNTKINKIYFEMKAKGFDCK